MPLRRLLLSSQYAVILLLLLFSIWLLATQKVSQVKLTHLNSYQCDVKKAIGTQIFNVYMPTNFQVTTVANALCEQALKGGIYTQVNISWQPRESLNSDLIMSQNFNLMWHRKHALTGLLPNWNDFYHTLIELPNYSIYWFSHHENISLSPEFFSRKVIGLLADKKSASGYLAPMSQISQAGIELSDEQIHFYPNRETLIDDFLLGKLDMIPGINHYTALSDWPEGKKRLITNGTSLGSWFVSAKTPESLNLQPVILAYLHQLKQAKLKATEPSSTIEVKS